MFRPPTGETTLLEPVIIANDGSDNCEDCPIINLDPPADSDCPYFEKLGSIPFCKKDDGTERMIDGGRGSTGIGNMVLPDLVELIENDQQLPGIIPIT